MSSNSSPWKQSPAVFWLAAILFPPAGLLLLWKRPGVGIFLKLAGTGVMFALGVAHLILVWGLRVELDGNNRPTILTFGRGADAHFEELERNRELQRPPEPAAPAAAAEAAVEAAKEEAAPATGQPAPDAPEAEAPAPPVPEPYWADYRGPNRDGVYTEMPILTDWPGSGLDELWRQPVGGGYASFVVAQGKAFTIEQRRDQEVVAAYDMNTGAEIWTDSWDAHWRENMGGPGPRATPVWHEGRLYALGAEGDFRCLDAETGRLIWSKNILEENGATNIDWAMAAAPLIVEEKVIVQPGGSGGRSIVAYDRLTGARIWSALNDTQAYTSPMVVTLAGQRQLLAVTGERAVGLTVDEGRLLWEYPWVTSYGVNAAQPLIVGGDRFFISAGYGHGAAMVEIAPSGDGFEAKTVWETNRMKNKFSTSVFHEGYIYGLDEAILACIDAETGKLQWKGGRYGYGQVLLASGHLVITTERGDVVLVRATPEGHQEVAGFSAVKGKTWNTPAIDGGRLLVRNTREMVCYRIGNAQ